VLCECNHLSLFSAIGNKERISVEEYREIPTVESDMQDSEEEDDHISFSIVILIGGLIFIQILISISGIYIDSKQDIKKFKMVNLSKFPQEVVESSLQPRSGINSNQVRIQGKSPIIYLLSLLHRHKMTR
jgi:hypothetical protein